ncbi:hypothetical protein D9M70_290950 [compost metagenome]
MLQGLAGGHASCDAAQLSGQTFDGLAAIACSPEQASRADSTAKQHVGAVETQATILLAIQPPLDRAGNGVIDRLRKAVSGLAQRAFEATALVDGVIDGVRQVALYRAAGLLDAAQLGGEVIQGVTGQQVPNALDGVHVGRTEGGGDEVVTLQVGGELVVLGLDVLDHLDRIALGLVLVEEPDARGLLRILAVLVVGEHAQGAVGQGRQAFGIRLEGRQGFHQGQRLIQAEVGRLSVAADASEDIGQVLQLGVTQPPGDHHLVQEQGGFFRAAEIDVEVLRGHTHGLTQLDGIGLGHRHGLGHGQHSGVSFGDAQAGGDQGIGTALEFIHPLAGGDLSIQPALAQHVSLGSGRPGRQLQLLELLVQARRLHAGGHRRDTQPNLRQPTLNGGCRVLERIELALGCCAELTHAAFALGQPRHQAGGIGGEA